MALDATLGSPTANSYVTVAEAGDLMPTVAAKARVDLWTPLDSTTKEGFLIRAVKMIETYVDFDGIRVNNEQPLDWPRDWVYGPDRFWPYPSTAIPSPVKEAQCLMALALNESFDQDVAAGSPIDRLQISTLRISFASSRSARGALLIPAEVVEKLRGFGDYVGASGMARAVSMVRS